MPAVIESSEVARIVNEICGRKEAQVMSPIEQIRTESVVRLKALLDQAAALRRLGVDVEAIITDLERVLHGWTGQTQKQAVLSDLASTGHLATPSYACECS